MGTYQVAVEAEFPASHQLRMVDGRLESMHGHVWKVRAVFAGAELDEIDVLIDFVEVERRLDDAVAAFRDRHLNDLPCFARVNPSAENVARVIFESLRDTVSAPDLLREVRLTEAPNCTASYREDP